MAKLLAHPNLCGLIATRYYYGQDGFEQNFGLAVFWTLQWMKGGHVIAKFILGMCYTCEVVTNNRKEGVKLLRDASAKLDSTAASAQARVEAQYRLGGCHFFGFDGEVEIDAQEAVKWFRLSAEGGHAPAQYQLAQVLYAGERVEKDVEEAILWYRKAAEQGHVETQFQFAMALIERATVLYGPNQFGRIRGDTAEAKEAVKWLRASALQGMAQAQCCLGDCLTEAVGLGLVKNPTEAALWYRTSADQGYARAQLQLGKCYVRGIGVAVDHEVAIRLFRLSGEDEAKDELRKLGLCE
eukprot:TRINITY_DN3448_c0_g2_i2.p1 TRINITY_DN3448_c0_g2~~TRINITY_DN3448_c0_g2_i2.p1  ORF type:complete len:338 (+),score=61.55 TRINITY_DN3448_c0_g2_i2:126-1016(+)